MEQIIKNKTNTSKASISRLSRDKKKGIVVLCLVAVMIFMWVKALTKKSPATIQAASVQQMALAQTAQQELNMTYIELPRVEGRNDVLVRDFFCPGNAVVDDKETADAEDGNDGEKSVIKMAKKFTLEAISLGKTPEAFINDKLMRIGDKISVEEGNTKVEFVIRRISDNAVVVGNDDIEIVLKLGHAEESTANGK
jgi:hypothetical protein